MELYSVCTNPMVLYGVPQVLSNIVISSDVGICKVYKFDYKKIVIDSPMKSDQQSPNALEAIETLNGHIQAATCVVWQEDLMITSSND